MRSGCGLRISEMKCQANINRFGERVVFGCIFMLRSSLTLNSLRCPDTVASTTLKPQAIKKQDGIVAVAGNRSGNTVGPVR